MTGVATPTRTAEVRVTREDWKLFASLATLPQKAGVPERQIPRLVVKELVDNALDAAGECESGHADDSNTTVYVENPGDIPGSPGQIAELFSIGRPLTSSKLTRRLTRGALGNGLRVVAGAVLATGGTLVVHTGGRRLVLRPLHDGTTAVASDTPSDVDGTRVEVTLGGRLAFDRVEDNVFEWAGPAALMANAGDLPAARPSVHWHDADSFADLCRDAAPRTTVVHLLEVFDGLSGKASKVAGEFKRREAAALSRAEAKALYAAVKRVAKPPKHDALGRVGLLDHWGRSSFADTTVPRGGVRVPVRIEAWAVPDDEFGIAVCVNRTPTTAELSLPTRPKGDGKKKKSLAVHGGGLKYYVDGSVKKPVRVLVNVMCPFMPITSDGKEPDLDAVHGTLLAVVGKAIRRAQRAIITDRPAQTQKDVILANLDAARLKTSGGGKHRYSVRQLFYAVRPYLLALFGEPTFDYFSRVLREYEEGVLGRDLPGIYRDDRGSLYIPHANVEMPLGTMSVERFKRPRYTFNKILYCEKEGLFQILRDEGWPERYDCALCTSKGFATYAIADLLDLLEADGEPIAIFVVHDADGSGTLIVQSLKEMLDRRSGRQVDIINLGLEPEDAVRMGLEVERVDRDTAVGVADYVDPHWRDWLQTKRVELNAMTTPQFVEWLTTKLVPHDTGKVVPPPPEVAVRLAGQVRSLVEEQLREQILREAGFAAKVEARLGQLGGALAAATDDVTRVLPGALVERPQLPWWTPVEEAAGRLVSQN